jgi:hypothetical protein
MEDVVRDRRALNRSLTIADFDTLKNGDIIGLYAGDGYAVAVVERRFGYGNALRLIGLNPKLKVRILKSDEEHIYRIGKNVDIPEAFIINVFFLPEQEEKKWKFVLDKERFLYES